MQLKSFYYITFPMFIMFRIFTLMFSTYFLKHSIFGPPPERVSGPLGTEKTIVIYGRQRNFWLCDFWKTWSLIFEGNYSGLKRLWLLFSFCSRRLSIWKKRNGQYNWFSLIKLLSKKFTFHIF